MRRPGRVFGVVLLVTVLGAGGAALAAPGRRHRPGLSVAQVKAAQSTAPARVIVLLRNQHANLPPSPKRIGQRRAVLRHDQTPLQASVARSGGRVTRTYGTVNAFAATVSRDERNRLAASSAVAEVLPDVFVRRPDPGPSGGFAAASPGTVTPSAPAGQEICPTDPSKPLVEPEALSIIHATDAQQLATGKGVKVAFVAEGIDINNPDFIRPDGSHVFVDYRDFSGDGPNARTSGAEAFGDASSIAAQGTTVHDLSRYVNPAHPLPAGCNVVLRGVAPDASLVGIKVFPEVGGAFTSVILQGMDWAVSQDHVNVLNESFGNDPIPDTDQDATKQFNRLAVAAGTTVTASSGDQGTANTIGSPASDPSAIDAGATTQFRHFAQTDRGGYQLGAGGWVNENIAEFSSAGFTQSGRTVDLVAPGNESYETCTPDATLYSDCINFAGQPSDIRYFGGTSESAPLTAGVAALVIQAYRDSHGGATPTPARIKQLILSNANDLNIPSNEQGAGELDALAAVHAAQSLGSGSRSGDGRLVNPSQLDLSARAGASTGASVTVSNDGGSPETIRARLRALNTPLSRQRADVTLNHTADPQFVNERGVAQAYKKLTFTIPSGADRLDASIAYRDQTGKSTVNLTLFDPAGRFTAFSYHPAGGGANFSHISVRNPPGGTWTAVFSTPAGSDGYSGVVHYDFSTSRFGSVGSVTPASVTLAPGATASLRVAVNAPSTPGDYSRDLQLTGTSGKTTVVPVVLRALIPLAGGQASYSGTITGGNGNGFVGREDTFAFDVPRGAPAANVSFRLPNDPNTQVLGYLVAPDGQTLGQQAAVQRSDGTITLKIYRANPQAGRWRFVLVTPNPVGGTTTAARFTGAVSLIAPPVQATGIPNSPGTVIAAGGQTTAKITVTNNGANDMNVFIDPRRAQRTLYSLVGITKTTGVSLPLPGDAPPPAWVVPTQTDLLLAAATGSAPITFDWGFGDPDLEARSLGNTAASAIAAPELTPGPWSMTPALLGPFDGPATGTVDTGLVARARVFDAAVTSPTGDPQLQDIDPNASAGAPIVVAPGHTATIPVTFSAAGARPGQLVRGDVFVDDNQAALIAVNEITAIPYEYRVR
ncbi:MAG: S8 family serine peptidase [Solirubrobacterales bacterium]|nr:S8 family serine peptidase [Solirubrobacterales bacterium]